MRHDLLSQHIERVAQKAAGLDEALAHAAYHHRRLQQIATMLRVQRALAGLADAVPGTADALQPTRDGARRLDLNNEIDCPHVDTQLEAAGGDDGPQLAALQLVLDDHPLLTRQRTMVRLDELALDALLLGQLIEPRGKPLGEAAPVAEDDGAAVLQNLLQNARVDAGPNAAALTLHRHVRRATGDGVDHLANGAHVFHRHYHVDFQRLANAGVDDGDGPAAVIGLVPAEEVRNLLQRTLCSAEPNALRRPRGDGFETLEAEHQVRTPLRGCHGVNLVDDDGVHVDQRAAHLAGQHQVQALGRGDEQVDRAAGQRLTIFRRRIAGSHGDRGLDERHIQSLGRQPDAHQR